MRVQSPLQENLSQRQEQVTFFQLLKEILRIKFSLADQSLVQIKYTEKGEYSFIWPDGNSSEQELIDVTVKIIAVPKGGGLSEPQNT